MKTVTQTEWRALLEKYELSDYDWPETVVGAETTEDAICISDDLIENLRNHADWLWYDDDDGDAFRANGIIALAEELDSL